jgi:hypothetical protein
MADDDFSSFFDRVIFVVKNSRQWIGEHRQRFFK